MAICIAWQAALLSVCVIHEPPKRPSSVTIPILAGSTFVVFVPGLTQMQSRPTQTLGQEAQRKHAFGRLSTDV